MSDETPVLLSMRGVHKRFGPTIALAGVDLTLDAGEVLALVGENGAGKSTLMKTLSGAHAADEGRMMLAGRPYQPRGPLDARRQGVAMIYQELSIAPDLTVAENVLLGVEPRRLGILDWTTLRARARAALAEVGRDDIDVDRRAGDLAIAQQQLVEIARSVALGARVLVLDEPTSSLTRKDIANLFAMLRRLRTHGLGIIYISHFLEEVREISDRFTVLRDGSSVGGGITAQATEAQIIKLMVGRDVDDLYPRTEHTPGTVVLHIEQLAGNRRPKHATLDLHRGEVLGIAGLVGAGRTELLRTIFGLDRATAGTIIANDHPGMASPAKRWSQGLGLVSEDRKTEGLALGMSVADNITLPGLPMFVRPSRQVADCRPWIDKLAMKLRSARQPVSDLSGGNQQKVALARLLNHGNDGCDVMLLDEPTRGVDIGAKAQIYHLIDELARSGKAVLVVSSYLPELLGICDRIAVMSRGILGQAKPVADWDEQALMTAAIGQAEEQ